MHRSDHHARLTLFTRQRMLMLGRLYPSETAVTMKTTERLQRLRRALELEQREELARWQDTHQNLPRRDRVVNGLAVNDLDPQEHRWGLGGRLLLTLGRSSSAIPPSFRRGAVVDVCPLKAETPRTPATIVRARLDRLTLAFDAAPPPHVTEGRAFIELAPDTISYQRALATLRQVENMESGAARRRRDSWFGEHKLRWHTGTERTQTPNETLNSEQREAIQRAQSAQDCMVIHGPPGTGKSTVLTELMVNESHRGTRILATAASNAAVDHLCELAHSVGLQAVRVGHPGRVAERLRPLTLDLRVEQHPAHSVITQLRREAEELLGFAKRQQRQGRSRDRYRNAGDARRNARVLLDDAARQEAQITRAILDEASVVCATLSTLTGKTLGQRSFELAVVDEATQATEPMTLAAFVRSERVVLAGDPCQLSATVLSREALSEGLGQSALEAMLARHGVDTSVLLRTQYRMHESIMKFPSREMYDDALRADPSVASHKLELASAHPPLIFIDTAGTGFSEEQAEGSASLDNPGESDIVLQHANALLAEGLEPTQLGIITPYAAQASRLRDRGMPPLVEIDTVDAFQGREKEVILVSLVRSNPRGEVGFLSDVRRMNVALTRARSHLFVVGDSATLGAHPFYAGFIEHCESVGAYRSAWAWPEDEN